MIALPALRDNYIWTIVHEAKQSMTCVDPGEAQPVLNYAKKNRLALEHVLITHHHPDHTAGLPELLKNFPNLIIYGPADSRISDVNCPIGDGATIQIESYEFRALSTPGHTSTHLCYQETNHAWILTGDTLFSAGCGRVFDGTMAQLYRSLMQLKDLPEATQVFCGHEYTQQNLRFSAQIEPENETIISSLKALEQHPNQCSLPSTIALEKQINPFFRVQTQALQAYARKHRVDPNDPFLIFEHLRRAKDSFN